MLSHLIPAGSCCGQSVPLTKPFHVVDRVFLWPGHSMLWTECSSDQAGPCGGTVFLWPSCSMWWTECSSDQAVPCNGQSVPLTKPFHVMDIVFLWPGWSMWWTECSSAQFSFPCHYVSVNALYLYIHLWSTQYSSSSCHSNEIKCLQTLSKATVCKWEKVSDRTM